MSTESKDDLPMHVYDAIPYTKCVVSGGFALYHYLKSNGQTPSWKPADVDIACAVKDSREFHKLVTDFVAKTSAKERWCTSGRYDYESNSDHIVHSAEYTVPGVDKPVQIIGFDKKVDPHATVHELQTRWAHPPTGMSFTTTCSAKAADGKTCTAVAKVFQTALLTSAYALKIAQPLPPMKKDREDKWVARGYKRSPRNWVEKLFA